jgi:hypothetical protein
LFFLFLNNYNHKHAYAGQLNVFALPRALLVLHDRGIVLSRQTTTVAGQDASSKSHSDKFNK